LDSFRASLLFMDQRMSMSDTHQITPITSRKTYSDEKKPMRHA